MEKFKKTGENALRIIRGILDGTIPSEEISKTGISAADEKSVAEVLGNHTEVTKAMKRDAKIADLRHPPDSRGNTP